MTIINEEKIAQFLLEFETNPQNAFNQFQEENKLDLRPQLIPLITRDFNGQYIPKTTETYKHWRKLLFTNKNNYKKFSLLDYQGNSYTVNLPYLHCSATTLEYILTNKWYLPMDSQTHFIQKIKETPERFEAHIVQKKDKGNNSWIMLHVKHRT